jgi:hypothetical protein
MSKSDNLLKQATSFQKLALFVDRKSFLQAIAQQPDKWTNTEVNQWYGLDAGIPAPPASSKQDLGSPMTPPPALDAPAPSEPGKPAAAPSYPAIPTKIQTMLSRMLSERGRYYPVKIDGQVGPETAKALEVFQKDYNSQGLQGQALYDAVEKAYNTWQMNEKYGPKEPYNPDRI